MGQKSRPADNHTRQEKLLLKGLSARISMLAAKRGISIERLAYEAGVSKGYLYDLVRGKGNPSVIILNRIAEALETEIFDLLK